MDKKLQEEALKNINLQLDVKKIELIITNHLLLNPEKPWFKKILILKN